ncbi:MAG: chorismate mutase [Hadesarchaea archaeon]|nr:chorismate mutase [Hadesarchaea archaeon]
MSKEDLSELRKEIDEVDEKILDLLSQRLNIASEILKLKKESGRKIKDKKREQEVIERARDKAKEKGLDPEFAEDILRLIISRTAGAEKKEAGETGMWAKIQKVFTGNPAQLKVARVLFKYGLRARKDGNIVCNGIRIPSVQIANEAGVDRRAVDSTIGTIFDNEELREIFSNLRPTPYLKGVARQLGLGVIEIMPTDATQTGIISGVTKVISKHKLSIRQSITDDPYFSTQPKLTIITEEPVTGKVIEELRELPSVESVIVY